MTVRILVGDCRERLRELPDESVQCVVTSPPYWGLRDYGMPGQIGLEKHYGSFVSGLAEVFDEVRRVLRDDGTVWLNLGDSYATGAGRAFSPGGGEQGETYRAMGAQVPDSKNPQSGIPIYQPNRMPQPGLKPKDLCGIPWRVAFALQTRGWWLRQDIIWSKPNPMPESVTDRCTKAHEYLFLLSKSDRYYFDQEAILEPVSASTVERLSQATLDEQEGSWRVPGKTNGAMKAVGRKPDKSRYKAATMPGQSPQGYTARDDGMTAMADGATSRNKRSVWTVTTQPFSEAHFATFPPALIEPCILAGCPEGGTVLDPFGGAGTTGLVADRLGRDAILIELNPAYAEMAENRIRNDNMLFADVSCFAQSPSKEGQ